MKLYVISGLGADKKVFENINFPEKFSEIIFIEWLMPVSYTHLDVYKRQIQLSLLKWDFL